MQGNSTMQMGNRLMQEKKIQRDHNLHLMQIRSVKPTISFTNSTSNADAQNKNTIHFLSRRFTQHRIIEKENRLLLSKITNIMDSHKRGGIVATAQKPVDHWHLPNKNPSTKKYQVFYPVKSLNWTARKQELSRIANANQHLLKRIHEQKSDYDLHFAPQSSSKQLNASASSIHTAPITLSLRHPASRASISQERSRERSLSSANKVGNSSGARLLPGLHQLQASSDKSRNSLRTRENSLNNNNNNNNNHDLYGQSNSCSVQNYNVTPGTGLLSSSGSGVATVGSIKKKSKRGASASLSRQRANTVGLDEMTKYSNGAEVIPSLPSQKSSNASRSVTIAVDQLHEKQSIQQLQQGHTDYQISDGNGEIVEVLLEKSKQIISGMEFEMEVLLTQESMVILAEEVQGDQTKIIEIPRDKAIAFLEEQCANSISDIVNFLVVSNNQIYLVANRSNQEHEQEQIQEKERNQHETQFNGDKLLEIEHGNVQVQNQDLEQEAEIVVRDNANSQLDGQSDLCEVKSPDNNNKQDQDEGINQEGERSEENSIKQQQQSVNGWQNQDEKGSQESHNNLKSQSEQNIEQNNQEE